MRQFNRLVFVSRLRGLVAAIVLALSGGAAATSLASETDSQQEGLATQPGAPGDETGDGSATDTPLPVEVQPVVDPDEGVTGEGPGTGAPSVTAPLEVVAPEGAGPGVEAAPAPVGQPAIPPTVPPPPPPAPPAPAQGGAGNDQAVALVAEDQGAQPIPYLHLNGSFDERASAGPAPERAALEPAAQPQPAPMPGSAPKAQPVTSPVRPARFRIVQPGDSLWSIATDLLGPGASAGAVARNVDRLWELNEARIGTGDPDVLPIGTRLRLTEPATE